ncbi:MAG: SDR family NAD(P)-dependent oxidoreductase [Gammaproteobacteria bacterium]|nr:SDR family NAD(P)-dependent oxidoreductase [Gammaproteobacteria bacterium]
MGSALVTGTSTGIGLATALRLARGGITTYATMRDVGKAKAIEEASAAQALPIKVRVLDVTQPQSVCECVEGILAETDIDILVNNAGVAGATPLELVEEDKHRAMFETNYFGVMRMIRAVLPQMRERRTGTIVNLSSVAGRVAIPNQVPYSASKWALECASEALAHEVRCFGIRVKIIEPGVIITNIFDNAAEHTVFDKGSPYADIMRRNGKFYAAGLRRATQPDAVADTIFDAVTGDSEQLRYLVGADAAGWVEGRAAMSDEQWVAMGDKMPADDYDAWFLKHFSIDLRG